MAKAEVHEGANENTLTRDDVDALAGILDNLKDGARSAAQAGNKSVARMYQLLVKKASPIVTAGYARLEREDLAAINKQVNPPKYRMVRQPLM